MKSFSNSKIAIIQTVLVTIIIIGLAQIASAGSYQDLKDNPPPDGYVEVGITEMDTLGLSSSTLCAATVEKTDSYISQTDNDMVYQSYLNDVEKCESDGGKECETTQFDAATPEQKKAINTAMTSKKDVCTAQLKQLAGVAGMSLSLAKIAKQGKSFFVKLGWKIPKGLKSLGNMKKQIAYLVKAEKFYSQQKAMMSKLDSHQGR